MSHAGPWATDSAQTCQPHGQRTARALRSGRRAVLFGLRLWAAVCLALYVAYWLQLCQPSLGASLRKSSFRMVGTVIGAVAIVILTACFPQSRTGFLTGLAVWGAACGLMATILRNFASYVWRRKMMNCSARNTASVTTQIDCDGSTRQTHNR
jgi:hypothetical protein